jgi:predicted RNA binding protein YcfA (HicA-like mRNA interferase family)
MEVFADLPKPLITPICLFLTDLPPSRTARKIAGVMYCYEGKGSNRIILNDGWYEIETRGSHRQFKHPVKKGRVTITGKPSQDLAPGTFNSLLKQAGLK